MRRLLLSLSVVGIVTAFITPANAAAQQSVSLYLGGFVPRGEDARASGDVLFNNLFNGEYSLRYRIDDFTGFTFGGEWLVAIGDRLEAGLGAGVYSKKVQSTYADRINRNGSEIEQDLKLRIVPLTATLRFLPLGRQSALQPYVGGGVGVMAWRYSETGEFVDSFDDTIFGGSFVGSGSAAGPVILGGVRIPVGASDLGAEVRYQSAEGDLPAEQGFLGTKIDVGGFNYLLTFNIRF